MSESTTIYETCLFERYVIARFRLKDILPKYSRYTLNLKRFEKENDLMRTNILLGNRDSCRCDRCNPNTKN
jgi:hypothetical protein